MNRLDKGLPSHWKKRDKSMKKVGQGYCDKLILFSVKREIWKLFFVTRDLKVLRDPSKTH